MSLICDIITLGDNRLNTMSRVSTDVHQYRSSSSPSLTPLQSFSLLISTRLSIMSSSSMIACWFPWTNKCISYLKNLAFCATFETKLQIWDNPWTYMIYEAILFYQGNRKNSISKLDTFLFFPEPSCKFNSMILRNIAVCSVCWVFCIPIYSLHSFNLNNSNQHVRDVISVIYWRLKWLLISLPMSKEFVTFKLYSKL